MDGGELTGCEFIGMKPEDNKMPESEAKAEPKKRSPRKPVKSK